MDVVSFGLLGKEKKPSISHLYFPLFPFLFYFLLQAFVGFVENNKYYQSLQQKIKVVFCFFLNGEKKEVTVDVCRSLRKQRPSGG